RAVEIKEHRVDADGVAGLASARVEHGAVLRIGDDTAVHRDLEAVARAEARLGPVGSGLADLGDAGLQTDGEVDIRRARTDAARTQPDEPQRARVGCRELQRARSV